MSSSEIDHRIEKGNKTREKILKAAFQIIAGEGTSGLSGSKIAKAAGISKSNVFHHFSSVEEIPFEVLNMICQGLFNPPPQKGQPQTLESYLLSLGDIFYTMSEEEQAFMKTFYSYYKEAFYNEKYREYMCKVTKDYVSNVKNKITSLSGVSLSEEEWDRLSLLIAGAGDGLGIHSFFGKNKDDYLNSWKLFVEMVLLYIKNKKG